MVSVASLWLPILLAAVIVFIASFVMNGVLTYHRSDFPSIPNEGPLLEAIRALNLTPGQYVFPRAFSSEGLKEEGAAGAAEQLQRGPVGLLLMRPSGPLNMGKTLALWFLYVVGVLFVVAYVASRTLAPGAEYLAVFRVVGTVGFLAFSAAEIPQAIWLARSWSSVWKFFFDGLVYGALAAGAFGWLWPG